VCGGRERVGELWGGAGFSGKVRGCVRGVRRTFGCLRVIRRHVVRGIEALRMWREVESLQRVSRTLCLLLFEGE
jgi:hypothetical protein